MRPTRTAAAALTAIALTVAGSACSSSTSTSSDSTSSSRAPSTASSAGASSSSNTTASTAPTSAHDLWDATRTDLSQLTSVHVVDEKSATIGPGTRLDADVVLTGPHPGTSGTITAGETKVGVVSTDGKRWARYSRNDFVAMIASVPQMSRSESSAAGRVFGNRWIEERTTDPETGQDAPSPAQPYSATLTALMQPTSTASKALGGSDATLSTTMLDGTKTWLITATDGTKAWIGADVHHHLLRYEVPGSDVPLAESLALSRFDAPVDVTAPPNAVSASAIERSFGVLPSVAL